MQKRAITLVEAKARFINRYTMEHLPQWAKKPHIDHKTKQAIGYYKPQYKTDLEWYENTTFPGEYHIPKNEKFCHSHAQTWPLGQGFAQAPCMKGQE